MLATIPVETANRDIDLYSVRNKKRNCTRCSSALFLTVISNLVHAEMLFPLLTDQKELCGDNVQELIQIALRNLAGIVCENTLSGFGQPYFRRVGGRLSLNDVDMNRLSVFIGPEENQIASHAKQTRHSEFPLDQHSGTAGEHSVSGIPRRN